MCPVRQACGGHHMNDVVLILRDVLLEIQTVSRRLEYDEATVDSLQYITDMTKRAIGKLGGEV